MYSCEVVVGRSVLVCCRSQDSESDPSSLQVEHGKLFCSLSVSLSVLRRPPRHTGCPLCYHHGAHVFSRISLGSWCFFFILCIIVHVTSNQNAFIWHHSRKWVRGGYYQELGCLFTFAAVTSKSSISKISLKVLRSSADFISDTRCVTEPSVMAARWVVQCRHLANSIDLLMPVLMAGGWVRTPVLFFAVCGPKYTKLSLPVRECP